MRNKAWAWDVRTTGLSTSTPRCLPWTCAWVLWQVSSGSRTMPESIFSIESWTGVFWGQFGIFAVHLLSTAVPTLPAWLAPSSENCYRAANRTSHTFIWCEIELLAYLWRNIIPRMEQRLSTLPNIDRALPSHVHHVSWQLPMNTVSTIKIRHIGFAGLVSHQHLVSDSQRSIQSYASVKYSFASSSKRVENFALYTQSLAGSPVE